LVYLLWFLVVLSDSSLPYISALGHSWGIDEFSISRVFVRACLYLYPGYLFAVFQIVLYRQNMVDILRVTRPFILITIDLLSSYPSIHITSTHQYLQPSTLVTSAFCNTIYYPTRHDRYEIRYDLLTATACA